MAGQVSINGGTIYLNFNIGRNDIFEECTLFGYPDEEDIIQILNYCVLLAK